MAYSSGTFSRLYDWTNDRDSGVKIRADRMDAEFNGIATALTTAVLKDGTQTTTATVPFAYGISVVDNQSVTLGTNSDYTVMYDETTRDSLMITSNVEGAVFSMVLAADQGDDAGDEWKIGIADGGVLTIGNDINSAHTYVAQLTLTPNSTVASSTTAVAGNLTVGGSLTLGSGAVISEAEMEMLDGITAGTVAASKAVVVDANKDAASFRNITLTGELDAGSLDISGDADIDGTTNLDAVDIDGNVQLDGTLTVGVDDTGKDVKFFGATSGKYMEWDESADQLDVTGSLDVTGNTSMVGTLTIGADDSGHDVIFYGDTASANMTWDTSADDLILSGAAGLVVPDGQLSLGSTAITATAAEINLIDGGTSRGTTAVASGDGILINDGGTMRMTNVDTVSTYFASHSVGGGNIVTTGALDSGSITSGFGAIDNGTSGIRTNTFTAETSIVPSASDGATLGTASLEWADLYLADGGQILFGNDQDVTITHDPDDGLILKSTATGDDNPFLLTLQTGETDLAANDVIGKIAFQAPDEATDTDSRLVSAAIQARSEGDFAADANATSIDFMTGASEAAATKMTVTSEGKVGVGVESPAEALEVKTSSSPAIQLNQGGDYQGIIRLAGNDLEIRSSSGTIEFFNGAADGDSSSERMRIDNAGNVGILNTSPSSYGNATELVVGNHSIDDAGITIATTTGSSGRFQFSDNTSSPFVGAIEYAHASTNAMIFYTAASERMRILSGGDVMVGRNSNDLTAAGVSIEAAGTGGFVRSSGPCLILNRITDDGEVIRINQDGTTEGTVSVSGSTVAYGGFTGSHWSRLSDNSKPTILIGTVMESIDEMCDWYQAEYTSQEEEKYEDGDNIPPNKKVGDVKQEKIISKDSIALPEGKKVGDTITHTVNGVDYTAKILQEEDIKHAKCKVSDSADSKCVYGVFLTWDIDDVVVNDMKIASLGTYVIRIHKDQTVSKGDLLTSNGDGTAKKQDDDIIRSKTIGKVLSNKKQETYSDGSYIVPCALYCG